MATQDPHIILLQWIVQFKKKKGKESQTPAMNNTCLIVVGTTFIGTLYPSALIQIITKLPHRLKLHSSQRPK